eukprot:3740489-Amphidinium_carterae.1
MEVGAVHPDRLESHVAMFHGRPVADEAIELSLVLPEGEFEFWDDVHGGWLPNEAVLAARRLELEYMRKHRIYEK